MNRIEIPILNNEYKVYLLWGNPKSSIKWINKYFGSSFHLNELSNARGRCYHREDKHPVIWVKTGKYFYATMAHEAVHAIQHIWEYIEQQSYDELFAHSVAAIMRAYADRKR